MAYRAACELSDRIAAVGDVNGPLLVDCHPSSPVSVIDVRGMADTEYTPPEGGGTGCEPRQGGARHSTTPRKPGARSTTAPAIPP